MNHHRMNSSYFEQCNNNCYRKPYHCRYIFYIEDKISHLIKVRAMGINGYLATWGYNSPTAKDEAILNDITPICLSEISSIID